MDKSYAEQRKSKNGISRLFKALRYSLQGFSATWKTEAAFRQEIPLVVLGLVLAPFFAPDTAAVLLLQFPLILLLIVELINSAIEALADQISTDHQSLLGKAKDIGSAAVLVCILWAIYSWYMILK